MESFNDTIKFMMAKIMFTLRDFRFQIMDKAYPAHYHGENTLEIHYVKKGSGKVILDGKEFNVSDNWFYVVPPFVSHTQIPDKENPMHKYSIYLLVDDHTGFKNYLPLLKQVFVAEDKYNSYELFDKILFEFKNEMFGYNEVVVSCFKSIIIYLMRDVNFHHDRITKWMPDTKSFEIESIFLNEFATITLEDLSKRMFMGVREMQRFLEKNYHKSFIELKTEARMSYAINKLQYSNDSILDISWQCGYSTPEHFSYAFKKYFNTSPNKYRKHNKSK
jgi:AraC-like DNA-binding protein